MDARATGVDLYHRWAAMWNGSLHLAEEIIGDDFIAHLTADALVPPAAICDALSVAQWVAFVRARGTDLHYCVEVGPFADANLVVGYWRLTGFREVPDRSLRPFAKVGIDILRWQGTRLVECWTMNNNAHST